MAEIGSASLAIIPSFKGFQSNLEQGSAKAMVAAGATGGTAFGDAAGKSAGSKFRARMATAGKLAAVGLAGVAAAGFKFAGDSLAEAREAQKVGKLTGAVIKSTGGAAKVTAVQVGNLSGRLSEMAGVDDELVQSGANVLLTFTKIRNETGEGNKVFDRATLAALNMSKALDQDLKSASIQVGKALNDPVKGVTALGRAGVQFSEDQKSAIKRMVETGDTLGAQKVILRELDTQFRGAAKSQATEADKLSVAWGNFKEEVGAELLPVMDDFAVFLRKKGIPAAKEFGDWVQDKMIPAAKNAAEELKPLVKGVKDLAGFLNDLPKPAKIAGIATALGGIAALKLGGGGGGALGTVGKAVGLAKPVPVFVTNPGFGGKPGKGIPPVAAAGSVLGPIAAAASGWLGSKALGILPGQPGMPDLTSDKGKLRFARTVHKVGSLFGLFDGEGAKGIIRANDAASKLPNHLDQGKTAAENLVGEVFKLDGAIKKVEGRKATRFEAPNLLALLGQTREYDRILDGLDGRTVRTHITTTRQKNDIGEGGGGVVPGRSPRVLIHHSGDIRSDSPRDYAKNMQRRSRHTSGGGVDFP